MYLKNFVNILSESLLLYNNNSHDSFNIAIYLYTAPDVVIYDNACNLHQYMLNREPDFFSETWVIVDRFHWSNHTGTYSIYNKQLIYTIIMLKMFTSSNDFKPSVC